MARKLLIPLSAALTGTLIAASPAAAVTVTDCANLQSALDNESEAVVTLAEGLTCTGGWDLPPGRSVTLQGDGSGATLNGDDEERILTGFEHGTLVIRNLTFSEGWSDDGGGAILATGGAPITIAGSTFTGNHARYDGGAVLIREQTPVLTRSAGRAARGDEGDRVTITGNTFGGDGEGEANGSDANGGALAVYALQPVTLADNAFHGNRAATYGGGADVAFCDTATVTDNTFEDNLVDAREGSESGGSAYGGGLSIQGSLWSCYAQDLRGALEVPPEDARIEQSGNVFRSNELVTDTEYDGSGAGEYTGFASVSSTNDTFHANTISSGTFGSGGGLMIATVSGDSELRNLVATANSMSFGDGGGVGYGSSLFGASTTLSVIHATIAGNSVGEGEGAGISGARGQSLALANSIVHGNTGGPEISGFLSPRKERTPSGVQEEGGIDVAFSDACTSAGAAYPGEGNICADPKLAGVAAGDVHQTAASPTLDKASQPRSGGLTSDYEGQGRFLDYDRSGAAEPDMGADEAPAPELPQPQQEQQQPAAPAAGGVLGTQTRSCTSRRSFRIKLRNRGQKVVKATVLVNGKRVKVLRGKRLTSRVNLRGLPKGRYSVRIKLQLADGRTISGTRRYFTCRPGRKSGPPRV